MSFLAPLSFLAGLLAIPVVLLYMLRLRRREMPISSTFLWQQILLDREANTPWQRLRRNLLLFLQLLILALLVFALARPFIEVPAISTGQIALLIDASASMNATDSTHGTRFDEAKSKALEMINTLSADDSVTVIRVADVPEVLSVYTNDHAQLRAAIQNAQPSLAPADWSAALTLAAAGAIETDKFSMVLISDGGLGDAEQLPALPGKIDYLSVGTSQNNLAITALATRSMPGATPQLFAQVTNFGDTAATVVFDVRSENEFLFAERYTIDAGETENITKDLNGDFTTLQASIALSAQSNPDLDHLEQDNHAWTIAQDGGTRRVLLITEGNYFLEQVLKTLPGIEFFVGSPALGIPTVEFDLYIFDNYQPPTLPKGDLFFINPPASNPLFTVGDTIRNTSNPRVKSDDTRMQFVNIETLNLAEFKDISATWAETLMTTDGGALLLAGEIDGRRVAVMPFSLFQSDLPLHISYPILMSNLMDWYRPINVIGTTRGLTIGDTLTLRPPLTADFIRITAPDNTIHELQLGREQLLFAQTQQLGVYTLEVIQGGKVTQSAPFVVNLFNHNESDITPKQTIALGTVTVEEAVAEEVGQREFWTILALLALLVLLLEWYAYHRRITLPRFSDTKTLYRT